jgi:hypothetical protein
MGERERRRYLSGRDHLGGGHQAATNPARASDQNSNASPVRAPLSSHQITDLDEGVTVPPPTRCRVVQVMVSTRNPDESIRFYSEVFGLTFNDDISSSSLGRTTPTRSSC